MKVHAETAADIGADGFGQCLHLRTFGSSQIDQNQSLLPVYPGPAERTALPAALLYQPAG